MMVLIDLIFLFYVVVLIGVILIFVSMIIADIKYKINDMIETRRKKKLNQTKD